MLDLILSLMPYAYGILVSILCYSILAYDHQLRHPLMVATRGVDRISRR